MLNNYIGVGRLVNDPELKELENGVKEANICIAIPRSYKNSDGIYDTDFINCKVYGDVAINTTEFCKKGDIIGVKGRLETEKKDDQYEMTIKVEKVTFLSSKKD